MVKIRIGANALCSAVLPIADLVEVGIVRRQQASVYLKSLSDLGILEEQKSGRDKLFINAALLRLLTEG